MKDDYRLLSLDDVLRVLEEEYSAKSIVDEGMTEECDFKRGTIYGSYTLAQELISRIKGD